MAINKEGVRVTWLGLVTLSLFGILVYRTADAVAKGNVFSPVLWSTWLLVAFYCLIVSVMWQLNGLVGLSNRPVWPIVLSGAACLASLVLLVVSFFS
jgi:hypothetical protein